MNSQDKWKTVSGVRREYGATALIEETLAASPFVQFRRWFEDVLASEISDPTAMVLSTVDHQGCPDSRVVLLKGIEEGAFVFYTNYESSKAAQLDHTPVVALNFYWPTMVRQVRIRGRVSRTSPQESETYFASRPLESQIAAIISPQSQRIADRHTLETSVSQFKATHANDLNALSCPDYWGGYRVNPSEIEFWQGRDNRLHDRILYQYQIDHWQYSRLAP